MEGRSFPQDLSGSLPVGLVTLSGKIDESGKITYISRGIGTSNLDITLRASPPEIVVINPQPRNLLLCMLGIESDEL